MGSRPAPSTGTSKTRTTWIAAVIERSFANWLRVFQLPNDLMARGQLMEVAAGTAKAVLDSPDFLRLGLMLALERRPVEPVPGRCTSGSAARPTSHSETASDS